MWHFERIIGYLLHFMHVIKLENTIFKQIYIFFKCDSQCYAQNSGVVIQCPP